VAGGITATGTAGNASLTAKGGTADLILAGTAQIGSKGTTSLTAGRTLSQAGGGLINGGTVAMARVVC